MAKTDSEMIEDIRKRILQEKENQKNAIKKGDVDAVTEAAGNISYLETLLAKYLK